MHNGFFVDILVLTFQRGREILFPKIQIISFVDIYFRLGRTRICCLMPNIFPWASSSEKNPLQAQVSHD